MFLDVLTGREFPPRFGFDESSTALFWLVSAVSVEVFPPAFEFEPVDVEGLFTSLPVELGASFG